MVCDVQTDQLSYRRGLLTAFFVRLKNALIMYIYWKVENFNQGETLYPHERNFSLPKICTRSCTLAQLPCLAIHNYTGLKLKSRVACNSLIILHKKSNLINYLKGPNMQNVQ